MTLNRFEAWWTRNPARAELNPVAKEVARTVWHAAQNDLVSQLRSYPLQFGQALQEHAPDGHQAMADAFTSGQINERVQCET